MFPPFSKQCNYVEEKKMVANLIKMQKKMVRLTKVVANVPLFHNAIKTNAKSEFIPYIKTKKGGACLKLNSSDPNNLQ